MNYTVIDNFLSREEFVTLKSHFFDQNLLWQYQNQTNYGKIECDDRFNFQMIHMFYQSPDIVSDHLPIVYPILKKLNLEVLLRVKANLTTCSDSIQTYGYHIDIPEKISKIAKTAVFYINTNDGYTVFKDSQERVASIENRLVIFDADMHHSGTNCTNEKVRAVINFNYI